MSCAWRWGPALPGPALWCPLVAFWGRRVHGAALAGRGAGKTGSVAHPPAAHTSPGWGMVGPWVPTFSIRLASCNSDTDPFKGTLRALVTQELRCWGRVCGQSPEQHGHRQAPHEGTGHRRRGGTMGRSHMVDFLLEDSGGWGSRSRPHVCVPGNGLHTCAGWEGTAGP